eukprot:4435581-Pleurochrysis_carterae.AAC.2
MSESFLVIHSSLNRANLTEGQVPYRLSRHGQATAAAMREALTYLSSLQLSALSESLQFGIFNGPSNTIKPMVGIKLTRLKLRQLDQDERVVDLSDALFSMMRLLEHDNSCRSVCKLLSPEANWLH